MCCCSFLALIDTVVLLTFTCWPDFAFLAYKKCSYMFFLAILDYYMLQKNCFLSRESRKLSHLLVYLIVFFAHFSYH